MTGRAHVALLVLAVGMVLADSSVVILALPDILQEFHLGVRSVSYVLISFNAVLALAAVPAAHLSRRFPATRVLAAGLVLFAIASLGCALSDGIALLVVARSGQAVAGAAIVCAARVLLRHTIPTTGSAVRLWVAAGVAGTAVGPAVGGALTQLFGWKAIFLAQVPVALVVLAAVRAAPARDRASAADEVSTDAGAPAANRPGLAGHLALGLASAALIAALFLIVLLLVNGWRLSPLAAAVTVSVMPLAAIAAGRMAHPTMAPRPRAVAGLVLIAGGLAGLALLPHARIVWTIAPQALIGLGLGLAVTALTESALAGRHPGTIHAGWTIASRHAGVVLGILVLTPLFTADLADARRLAEEAGTAQLLDAKLPVGLKVSLGNDLVAQIRAAKGRLPDVAPAFAKNHPAGGDRVAFAALERGIIDQVERAGTHAFSRSFLAAAILALLAIVPAFMLRRRDAT